MVELSVSYFSFRLHNTPATIPTWHPMVAHNTSLVPTLTKSGHTTSTMGEAFTWLVKTRTFVSGKGDSVFEILNYSIR